MVTYTTTVTISHTTHIPHGSVHGWTISLYMCLAGSIEVLCSKRGASPIPNIVSPYVQQRCTLIWCTSSHIAQALTHEAMEYNRLTSLYGESEDNVPTHTCHLPPCGRHGVETLATTISCPLCMIVEVLFLRGRYLMEVTPDTWFPPCINDIEVVLELHYHIRCYPNVQL